MVFVLYHAIVLTSIAVSSIFSVLFFTKEVKMKQATTDVTPFMEAQCQNLISLYALYANKPGAIAGKSDFPAALYKQAHRVKCIMHRTHGTKLDYIKEQLSPSCTNFFFGRREDKLDTKQYLELLAKTFDQLSQLQKKTLDDMAKILVDEQRSSKAA